MSDSSPSSRPWDAPPTSNPPPLPSSSTSPTLLLAQTRQLQGPQARDGKNILRITLSPSGFFIAASSKLPSIASQAPSDVITFFDVRTPTFQSFSISNTKVNNHFVWMPPQWPDTILCPNPTGEPFPRMETYDVAKKSWKSAVHMGVRAPLAIAPGGSVLAAVSVRDPRHVFIVNLAVGPGRPHTGALVNIVPHHMDEVTHLEFTNGDEELELVSVARDGTVRVTSVKTGRTLRKMEVEARVGPELLSVSPDGDSVTTVWGNREVMLWRPRSGEVNMYRLDAVRRSEGWPLCISKDGRYLLCRTEEGFDVSDLETGRFRGEVVGETSFATAATFSADGRYVAVGKFSGEVQLYEVVPSENYLLV